MAHTAHSTHAAHTTSASNAGGFVNALAFVGKAVIFFITGGFAYPNIFIGGTAADLAPGETKQDKK